MNRLIVRIKVKNSQEIDMEMPGDLKVEEIIKYLKQNESWPTETETKQTLYYSLLSESGYLNPELTLKDLGIGNNFLLRVETSLKQRSYPKRKNKTQPATAQWKFSGPIKALRELSAQDRRGSLHISTIDLLHEKEREPSSPQEKQTPVQQVGEEKKETSNSVKFNFRPLGFSQKNHDQ